MFKICPICKTHLRSIKDHNEQCSPELTFNEFKHKAILFNFPELTRENVFDLYVKQEYSLPMFTKKYDITYGDTLFLLDYYKIPKRTHKESLHLETVIDKRKETCIERYGADNPTRKGTAPYLKREQTMLDRYGVDNIFKQQEFKDYIQSDEPWLKNYGLTSHEFHSMRSKNVWLNKSEEEQINWFTKSIGNPSTPGKLEIRMKEMLDYYEYRNHPQFPLDGRYYDFEVEGVLIEVNGDFFHANPLYYAPEEELNFPDGGELKIAKELWYKDFLKLEFARFNGYDVIYIWENEINKCKTISDLRDLYLRALTRKNKYVQEQ